MTGRGLFIALSGALALALGGASAFADPLPKIIELPDGAKDVPPDLSQPVENGKARIWFGKDLKEAYGGQAKYLSTGTFGGTSDYKLMLVRRVPIAPADADSEFHEGMSQIYFILSGTGTQVLGGTPSTSREVRGKNRLGHGPLAGGTSYRIGPGDVILIPPQTWHQTLADPGQTVTYEMVNIYLK